MSDNPKYNFETSDMLCYQKLTGSVYINREFGYTKWSDSC